MAAAAAAAAKEIVLVTGANSGIGFELARQLLARGSYHVYLGARSASRGQAALQELQSRQLPGTIDFLPLDLQSDEQMEQAVKQLAARHGRLDMLINNAAVALPTGATERERIQTAFNTNATGPYLLTCALIPLLRQSSHARIINISSGAGSIARRLAPESPMYRINGVAYRASKVALNMMTMCLHVEFGLGVRPMDSTEEQADADADADQTEEQSKNNKINVFCYDPGFTVSNLSPHNTKESGARSAEDTVTSIMELVDGKRDADQGKFIHNTGEYPW